MNDEIEWIPIEDVLSGIYSKRTSKEIIICNDNWRDILGLYYQSAKKIERMLFNAYWNADFAFCRKRLSKRYDDLFSN